MTRPPRSRPAARSGSGRNHYLAGNPPFDLQQYRGWIAKAGYPEGD